jgi:hypothetical protein
MPGGKGIVRYVLGPRLESVLSLEVSQDVDVMQSSSPDIRSCDLGWGRE